MRNIFLSSDHTGGLLVEKISDFLASNGFNPIVLLLQEGEDYTDAAKKVSAKVLATPSSVGIVVCGSGVGVSIVCNRFKGIRAALCHSPELAKLSRLHNDANVLCLGARMLETSAQLEMVKIFLNTDFEGARHAIRINKIDN